MNPSRFSSSFSARLARYARVSTLWTVFFHNSGRLLPGHPLEIDQPQNLPVFRLQTLHRPVKLHFSLLMKIPLFQQLLIREIRTITKGNTLLSCRTPQIIQRQIPADCIQPCFECGQSLMIRFFQPQPDKRILGQLVCKRKTVRAASTASRTVLDTHQQGSFCTAIIHQSGRRKLIGSTVGSRAAKR